MATFGKKRIIAGTLAGAAIGLCLGGGCPSTTPTAKWEIVFSDLSASLLSISGTSKTDVYAVGADPKDGLGPCVVHFDGQTWQRRATGQSGNLWWISDPPINGVFYMVGEAGLILRYDPATGIFTKQAPPDTPTLFGVWGTDESHIWACGGNLSDPDHGGAIWQYDGVSWNMQSLANVDPAGIPVAYKVWGRSASDVYVCGDKGLIVHFDGTAWSRVTTSTNRRLFTIRGNDSLVAAVGGFGSGVLLELNGDTFTDVTPPQALQFNGVYVPDTGDAVAAGNNGTVYFRTANGWEKQTTGVPSTPDDPMDLHAAWVDPSGGVWASGGDLTGGNLDKGILIHYGTTVPNGDIVQP